MELLFSRSQEAESLAGLLGRLLQIEDALLDSRLTFKGSAIDRVVHSHPRFDGARPLPKLTQQFGFESFDFRVHLTNSRVHLTQDPLLRLFRAFVEVTLHTCEERL
jgi:hypothetical protein